MCRAAPSSQAPLGPLVGREGLEQRLVAPGRGQVASRSVCFQVRAGTSSPSSRKGGWSGQSWLCWRRPREEFPECVKAASLSLGCCVSLEFWPGVGQGPCPSSPSASRHHPGQQGLPHPVPGRAGVPTWHRHTLLSPVTGQRSHCCCPGRAPKAAPVPLPPGRHPPAVVPLQRLPHRARGQGERLRPPPLLPVVAAGDPAAGGGRWAAPCPVPGQPHTVPLPPLAV